MGEYWKPVNLTRREYVHPHRVNDGLKLGEWNYPGSHTRKRVDELIATGQWRATDDIRIASDYGQQVQMYGAPGPAAPPTIDDDDDNNLYSLAGESFADVSLPTSPAHVSHCGACGSVVKMHRADDGGWLVTPSHPSSGAPPSTAVAAGDRVTWCSQCGQPIEMPACGPTHAMLAAVAAPTRADDSPPADALLTALRDRLETAMDDASREIADAAEGTIGAGEARCLMASAIGHAIEGLAGVAGAIEVGREYRAGAGDTGDAPGQCADSNAPRGLSTSSDASPSIAPPIPPSEPRVSPDEVVDLCNDFIADDPVRGRGGIITNLARDLRDARATLAARSGEGLAAKVLARAKYTLIRRYPLEFSRRPYFRCQQCSWTWDEGAPEQHAGHCLFAPLGLAPDHTYRAVPGEPLDAARADRKEPQP